MLYLTLDDPRIAGAIAIGLQVSVEATQRSLSDLNEPDRPTATSEASGCQSPSAFRREMRPLPSPASTFVCGFSRATLV